MFGLISNTVNDDGKFLSKYSDILNFLEMEVVSPNIIDNFLVHKCQSVMLQHVYIICDRSSIW
jgi:hypothetical protein